MGHYASGVTVVASLDEAGEPAGLTCQSFHSLSSDPALVLVCIGRFSRSWHRIEPTGRFAVSILSDEQQDACLALASARSDKFADVAWDRSAVGTVHIAGALATVDCDIEAVYPAGDHLIVVGRVVQMTAAGGGSPLLFFRSAFRRISA